jgi:hypothetical protein
MVAVALGSSASSPQPRVFDLQLSGKPHLQSCGMLELGLVYYRWGAEYLTVQKKGKKKGKKKSLGKKKGKKKSLI